MRAGVRKGNREETIPVTKKTEELFMPIDKLFRCQIMDKHIPIIVLAEWMFLALMDMLTHANPLINFLFVLGYPVFLISLGISVWRQLRQPQ